MGRFDTIKTTIDANIKENGSQEITGQKMNSILTEMVNATDAELTELESVIYRVSQGNAIKLPLSVNAYIDRERGMGYYPGAYGTKNPIKIGANVPLRYTGSLWSDAAIVEYDSNFNIVKSWNITDTPEVAVNGYITQFEFTTSENTTYIDFCSLSSKLEVIYLGDADLTYKVVNRDEFLSEWKSELLNTQNQIARVESDSISRDLIESNVIYRVSQGNSLAFPISEHLYFDRERGLKYYPGAYGTKNPIKIGANVPLRYTGSLWSDAAIVEYDSNFNIVKSWNITDTPEVAVGGYITQFEFTTSENTTYIDFCSLNKKFNVEYLGDADLDYLIVNRDEFAKAQSEVKVSAGMENSLIGAIDFEGVNMDGYSHIILYGQSLSTGDNSYVPVTGRLTPVQKDCYMVGADPTDIVGDFAPLKAGVPNNSSYVHSNGGESPICNAVYAFKASLNHTPYRKVKLIGSACGWGGKTIEDLGNVNGIYYNRFKSVVTTAKANAGNEPINCPAIIWMQGEYNQIAGSGTTIADYKQKIVALKNNMQQYVMDAYGQTCPPLFYVYQTSIFYTPKFPIVAQALYEASLENEDIILMNPHYFCPTSDAGHLTSNGYRWYGEYIAKSLNKTLLNNVRSTPIMPKNIVLDAENKRIDIDFLVPNPPMRFEINQLAKVENYGFAVYSNGQKCSISEILLQSTRISIYFNASSVSNIEIEYAGQATNGRGNICDSDEYVSFGKFINPSEAYTTGASSDGGYNPSNLSSSDLSHKDSDGQSLVGKKYPNQNWLATFRISL